jgi:hypothetical protein
MIFAHERIVPEPFVVARSVGFSLEEVRPYKNTWEHAFYVIRLIGKSFSNRYSGSCFVRALPGMWRRSIRDPLLHAPRDKC